MSQNNVIKELFDKPIGNKIWVAPMAGVTDRPFRSLCKYFGAGHAVSEMMTSDQTLRMSKKVYIVPILMVKLPLFLHKLQVQTRSILQKLRAIKWPMEHKLSILIWGVQPEKFVIN